MAGCFQPAQAWLQAVATETDLYPEEERQETPFINTINKGQSNAGSVQTGAGTGG